MNTNPSTDRDWINSVVTEYEGPLTIYAARLLGDVDRGRDVVQDTFLKLWQADQASIEGHVAKWLYTVCRNRALDVRRKEHRMTTLEPQTLQAKATSQPPDDKAASGETRLLEFVETLPERQQEALRLKFQGGLSYREIAEVMNTTVNNVGVILHTAVKTVRQRMTESLSDSSNVQSKLATR